MLVILGTLSFFFSVFFVPWVILLFAIIFLASIGKSIGVRRLYVKFLLALFEYGRKDIELAQKKMRQQEDESEDEGYVEEIRSAEQKEISKSHIENDGNHLISREGDLILVPDLITPSNKNKENGDEIKKEEKIVFNMKTWLSILDYTKSGMEAIIEDQVTSRFEAEELKSWNLLTRTDSSYEFISWKLTFLWLAGFFGRYLILLPLRLSLFTAGVLYLLSTSFIIGQLPDSPIRQWLSKRSYLIAMRILTRSVSAVITIHNKQWKPQNGSICVANHTSPIDCIILSNDNCYSLIGQSHGGILGLLQRALATASPHIWFERSEARDKKFVLQRLREHTSDRNNPPMLIFPEGTCINNTSVMQFKKGSFEVGSVIYPVAVKYDPRFGEAFWNSSKYSMAEYLYRMMTSWAIVCDVWYLPPVQQKDGETSIDYANRIKNLIAKQGGLVDLVWDGQLKRTKPKKEWKERQQEQFSMRFKTE